MTNADKQHINSKRVVGKPFKKGQSGNPKGRPKMEVCIPDILRSILQEKIGEGEKITRLEAILKKVVKMAYDGDHGAIDFLADRTEGKAVETVRTQVLKDELIIE